MPDCISSARGDGVFGVESWARIEGPTFTDDDISKSQKSDSIASPEMSSVRFREKFQFSGYYRDDSGDDSVERIGGDWRLEISLGKF